MPWTKEQLDAVSSDGNLIVSAAAGAGKTAVLTERICRRIMEGTPVESMLVLTFTRAASAEMKTRIEARLNRAAEEADGETARYLRAEAGRVGSAYISTVHAFCMRVLKRHAHRLGLPPDIRVADELTAAALNEQVKDQLLTGLCGENNPDWLRLLSAFGGEEPAWTAVAATARFLESQPDPEKWLADALDRYASEAGIQAQLDEVLSACREELSLAVEALTRVRDGLPPSWGAVIGVLDDDIMRCRALAMTADYDAYRQGLLDCAFQTLRFPKGTSEREKPPVKSPREAGKALIKEQRARLARPYLEECAAMADSGGVLFALAHVVSAYRSAFTEAKRGKALLDYADLEHEALSLLSLPDVAAEYREKFRYIAIDEYQDSNRVQDAIIEKIRRADNLFFVGDVKQSIYRFRQAEPGLFLQKLTAFTGEAGRRIDLNKNFRSAAPVLNCVNGVFANLMSRAAGEMDYDERARLIPGTDTAGGGAELHVIERTGGEGEPAGDLPEDEAAAELEAAADAEVEGRLIAERIRAILASETIDDPGAPGPRAPVYADFAVLMRSTTHAQRLAETLSRCGIPCYAQVNGGYFDAVEVQVFLNLLRVIDNRRQDVPLLSVLLSSVGDFTPAELLRVRTFHKEGSFSDAQTAVGAGCPEEALSRRAGDFLALLDRYRGESRLIGVEQLIGLLLDETGFYEEMGASYGGAQRQANLDALLSRAHAFESGGGRGLWSILRHMELASYGASLGAAQTLSANVVRILTIHKSKGLEFPYVFVTQLGARFPTGGGRGREALQLHPALGLGLRIRKDGTLRDTALRRTMIRRLRREQLSEEMRVLYVAMTRAKSRLILIGCQRNAAVKLAEEKPPATPLTVLTGGTPLDWLLLTGRAALPAVVHARKEFLAVEQPDRLPGLPKADPDMAAVLAARFRWTYPYEEAVRLPGKASVSRVSGDISGAPVRLPEFNAPDFLPAGEGSAAFFGTAVHTALQHLPLDGSLTPEGAASYLARLVERGVLTREQGDAAEPEAIGWFLGTELFSRMQKSPRVERELAFGYEADAAAVFHTDAEERVLLQGVIDGCFMENGGWVLLDYKTDRLYPPETEKTLAERHRGQLRLYAAALSALTGVPVTEQWVVLLSARACVKL